jgi:hypothetical protein
MTLRLYALLLAATCAFAPQADAQSAFDGTWTGQVVRPAPNPNQNLTIVLKTDAGKVSGSIRGADPGETAIDWGIVKGDLITFRTTMTVFNKLETMVYIGRLTGDQLALGRRPENLSIGQLVEFTATRSK